MTRFMPVSAWGQFVHPAVLAPSGSSVEVDGGTIRVRVGLLGSATIPAANVARLSRLDWPPLWGLGVRIARGMVGYVLTSGPCVVMDLDPPVNVRAPLRWRATRVAVRVDDAEALLEAIAEARTAA
ncbi:MAG: hypothetical protein U0Y82_14780 [Thermoleophilia bacterium]